jgi:hypothetical protein
VECVQVRKGNGEMSRREATRPGQGPRLNDTKAIVETPLHHHLSLESMLEGGGWASPNLGEAHPAERRALRGMLEAKPARSACAGSESLRGATAYLGKKIGQ